MSFPPLNAQRSCREEQFILVPASLTGSQVQNTTGVIEGAYRCTASTAAAGNYTLVYNKPFTRKPVVTAIGLHATSKIYMNIVSSTTSTLVLAAWNGAGDAAIDPTEVHVTVKGFDSADQIG